MSNFPKALLLLIAAAFYPTISVSSNEQAEGASTGITRSSTGRGVPYGSSADERFLPWLKASDDPGYGYTTDKPIEIGGLLEGRGNDWSSQYFSSLLGPSGEPTEFERVKSCCAFVLENPKIIDAGFKAGFLDKFKVTVEGQEPVYLYVTLYAEGKISAPKGFTTRGKTP